jgi:hypothetical protein
VPNRPKFSSTLKKSAVADPQLLFLGSSRESNLAELAPRLWRSENLPILSNLMVV